MTAIDALTSYTLKHLREFWWDDEFTEFLAERLRPRPGNRILDVGCGEGLAEVSIGRLHISQIRLVGVDLGVEKLLAARQEVAGHNLRVEFAAADAVRLPFVDGVFDSIFCVAVLQHVQDVESAVREFSRVTAVGGRVMAVEPDNAARYSYTSAPAGERAFALADRFFAAVAAASGETGDLSIGPKLPTMFERHRIEPVEVRLFPVSSARLAPPDAKVWEGRRRAVTAAMGQSPTEPVSALGRELLDAIEQYRVEAEAAGPAFVEIQNTMLLATVGQKIE